MTPEGQEIQQDLFDPGLGGAEGAFDDQLVLPLPEVAGAAPFRTIIKRDGREAPFVRQKITDAIFRAAQSIGGQDYQMAESLAAAVMIYLKKRLGPQPPTVDQVHDAVERVLIQMAHAKTALAYARYRDRRARIRRLREGDMRALLDELDEAKAQRLGGGQSGARLLSLHTSGETVVRWDRSRIVAALVRETGLERPMAELVAAEVEEQIARAELGTLTTSLVRELVSARLIAHGLGEYRERHRRLGVPLYDCARIIRGLDPETMGGSPRATSQVLARAVKKEFGLAEVFSPPVTEAHVSGAMHIHGLDAVDRLDRVAAAPGAALAAGLGQGMPGGPANAEAFLAQLVHAGRGLGAYFSGGVAWRGLARDAAPHLHGFAPDAMGQFARMTLYEFAFGALESGTPPRLELDWDPARMDHQAQAFTLALLDAFLHGVDGETPLPGPEVHARLAPQTWKADGAPAFLHRVAQAAALQRGIVFALDQEPGADSGRPDACMQRISINLPRAAYESGKPAGLLACLERLLPLAAEAHQEKRDFAELLMGSQGQGPLGPLARESGQGPWLPPSQAGLEIAAEGLAECVAVLLGGSAPPHHGEALELGETILAQMAALCERLARQRDLPLRLVANGDSGVSRRFAQLDLAQYPRTAATLNMPDACEPAYTTGVALPPAPGANPFETAQAEGRFHARLSGDPVTRVPLPHGGASVESVLAFVRRVHRDTTCRGLFFVAPEGAAKG